MDEPAAKDSASHQPRGLFYKVFRHQLPLESETYLFILMNVIDFYVTYWGLSLGVFQERNPIARWFLEGWGPVKGMLIYKMVLVAFICVIAQMVAARRIRTGRILLVGSSLGILGVIIYSVVLFVVHYSPAHAEL